jgi:predicted GIY-YIG superfamily endonuclease
MTVYLLHFTAPIGDLDNPHGAAQHYLGWTPASVEQRLNEHTKGIGAKICAAAVQAGADLLVARTWDGGYALEKRLKRYKKAHRLCPICTGEAALHRMRLDSTAPPSVQSVPEIR